MRYCFILLLFSCLHQISFSQLPLNFKSYAIRLKVSKDQSFVLTTRAGEVGLTSNPKNTWERSDPGGEKMFGTTLENSCFFNKDTGFVYGFIQNPKGGKYDIIYHTTNGAKKWKPIDFGQDGWVDDACNLDNGEAWLSVGGSGIAYTADYGFNWKKISIPEKKQRFTAIFFNSKHQGVIASLWNMIAYTNNNGENWNYLPTPLNQNKYNKTNKQSRPQFSRVAIFHNYILAIQEDLVFYTSLDSINWKWLPEYSDFYTDANNTALFFKTNKKHFVRSDNNLQPVFVFDKFTSYYDAQCRDGELYLVNESGIIKLNADNSFTETAFQTKGSTNIKPKSFGYGLSESYGIKDNKIYTQKNYDGPWEFQYDFPFDADSGILSVWNNKIFYQKNDSIYYLSLEGKLIKTVSHQKMIDNFCKAGIKNIIFRQGSRGCFHSYSDELLYIKDGDYFAFPVSKNEGSEHRIELPQNEDVIAVSDVDTFVSAIPAFFNLIELASIDDLGFTEKDYQKCKNDILDFEKSLMKPVKNERKKEKNTAFHFAKNNLDFTRLLKLVDSIKTIDTHTLNSILFNLSEMWSTTSNHISFTLVNNQNEEITFQSNYYEPNAFYFPWMISYNGLNNLSTSMTINNFLNKVYPAFLNENNKVQVLHTIVKRLY